MRRLLYNIGVLASYLFFSRSYAQYRLMRLLGTLIVRMPRFVGPSFQPGRHRISIQGFRHSCNSFVLTAIASSRPEEIHSHAHRAWAVAQAVRNGVTPIVLIRRPREVLESTIHRMLVEDWREDKAYRVYKSTLLATWYLYYRDVMRYADKICLVQFDEVTTPSAYRAVRQRILAQTGALLQETPDMEAVEINASGAQGAAFTFSPRTERIIAACDRLYDRLVARAAA